MICKPSLLLLKCTQAKTQAKSVDQTAAEKGLAMSQKVRGFFEKHSVRPNDIKYIVREEGKTVVYLVDGRAIRTYHPVKEFREELPAEDFFLPNKGIVAAASQVIGVRDGMYEMADGRTFRYRVHNSPMHDLRLLSVGRSIERRKLEPKSAAEADSNCFSLFDKMPLPVLVIEVSTDEHDAGVNFTMRYCNRAMLEYEGLSRDQVVDRPYSEVFGVHSNRWLVAYADVALNDSVRVVNDYDYVRHRHMTLYCYQPKPCLCACVLMAHADESRREIHGDFLHEVVRPIGS